MVVFEELFIKSKGRPVEFNGEMVRMLDEIPVGNDVSVRVEFKLANSEWRQGVSLTTEGSFEVGSQQIKRGIALWQDTAPRVVDVRVRSKSGTLQVKNIWDVGDGVVHSWHNGAAMIVDVDGETRRYRCNDGYADADFDDLVFSLTFIEPRSS
ncbi:MAG: hypothetical protein ACK5N9_25635 [Pirellula sp.]|jgi:hypothetical protein